MEDDSSNNDNTGIIYQCSDKVLDPFWTSPHDKKLIQEVL